MKILLTLLEEQIAPRFDCSTKVLIADTEKGLTADTCKTFVLPGPSADELCTLILKENIDVVVCGGIEDTHYQYLRWKKITVLDRVIASAPDALREAASGKLVSGAVLDNAPAGWTEKKQ